MELCYECNKRPIVGSGIFCSAECEAAWVVAMGRRLTTAREALGLSPDEVAGRLGISRRSYLAWEQGKRQRWTHMCVNLYYVAKLPISADWLICGEGEPLLDEAA